jgi:dTDP-4-amino-4,6-dideoxygalactose transaminase
MVLIGKRFEVTESFLPPLEELLPGLEQIWASKRLSNGGPFQQQFEQKLAAYLGAPRVAVCSNGSFALLAALDALGISGEVITTPFSFVATAQSLLWKGLTPVFADITPGTLTIDPRKVEAAVTERTSAILGVHLYGNPCAHEELRRIAVKYGLKLLYDAAHAFGVSDSGGSILRYGDLSVVSFHAAKVFTTFEGGAVICQDDELYKKISAFRNFGMQEGDGVSGTGFNGKMNEFQAALGILQLDYVNDVIDRRRSIERYYRDALGAVTELKMLDVPHGVVSNGGFFPVLLSEECAVSRDDLCSRLCEAGIMARRYFFPLISMTPPFNVLPSATAVNLPVACSAAAQILCLPIHSGLTFEDIDFITGRIGEVLHGC